MAGILISGDLSATGTGTVTYNDGKHILAFGHPFMNLGPVDMPMAKSEVVMTLASSYQPNKLPNTTDVVGALHQDRFSGIMGELGAEAPMVPVHLKLRSFNEANAMVKEKDFNFQVFVNQKYTPTLMMMTLASTIQQINEYADEITYRMSGSVEVAGGGRLDVSTILADGAAPAPPPLMLANWWGEKFNRLFANPVSMPKLTKVDCTIDLLPERRVAAIDSAWTPSVEVEAGTEIPVKVFLRPYRGERMERSVTVKIPAGLARGEHRILFSDADTLNRLQSAAAAGSRFMDIPRNRVAAESGTQQQPHVRLAGGNPRDVFHRRQDAAVAAGVDAERAARGSHRFTVAGRDAGDGRGAALGAVRRDGERKLFAADHSKVNQ